MISDPNVVGLLYLVSIVCFILALKFLSSPKHARRGNWVGGVGMVIAIATTLALDGISNWLLIVVGGLIGSVIGIVGARTVKMTAMPQMVALFNGVGGGAAALVAVAEFHIATAGLATTASVSTVLSALMVPPCSLTSSCTSARPMPEPSWVLPCAPATCWKRSKTLGS